MKKKKTSIDPFSQFPTVTQGLQQNELKMKLKEILDEPLKKNVSLKIDYNAPPIRIEKENKHISSSEKLDDWCEKWLKKNKAVRIIKDEYYPYKDYTIIEELLHKYGNDFINNSLTQCPIKSKEIKHEIYDSLAFVIFCQRIDPKSIIDIPEYGSFWDRISEHSHV